MIAGYHAVYEENYYSAIDNAVKYNFQFVQYDIAVPGFDPQRLAYSELLELRDYAKEKNIELCFHGPCDSISFFYDQIPVREGIINYYKSLLPKLDVLNTRHITIHLGDYSKFKMSGQSDEEFLMRHGEYFSNILYENIMCLLMFRENVMICVENCALDTFKISTLEEILNDTDKLHLTMDIAKAYNQDQRINGEVYSFMKKHISRVKEVHIHDWNKSFRSHQTVGTGFVDFSLFKDFYQKPDVYINYEVRPLEEAIRSREIFESKYT